MLVMVLRNGLLDKECGKAIVDGIKHSFSESTNVGVNLVKGLWNGINSVKDWILGKSKGLEMLF